MTSGVKTSQVQGTAVPQPQPGSGPKPANKTPPASRPANGAPSGPVGASAPCCWCKKIEKAISVHGSTYALSTQHPNHQVSYHLTVDLVGNEIIISRVMKWGSVTASITPAEKQAVRTGLTQATSAMWSNKRKLKITDTACNPREKTLPIRFKLYWEGETSRAADLTVNLVPGPSRSSASGRLMNLDTLDIEDAHYTLGHEFAHTLGQVDEYPYARGATVSADYFRANAPKVTISIPQTGNIMSDYGNHTMLDRFFWFVEIEVQKLLRSAEGLGRAGITCEVVS